MTLIDGAYASAAQYRARNASAEADDDLVAEVLGASSRYVDRRLGWAPRSFGGGQDDTRVFWPQGQRSKLHLRDSSGQWALRSWTQITVDYSGDGTPEHIWTPADAAWILTDPPVSADNPGRSLVLWGSHSDATETVWPNAPFGMVGVVGGWNWDVTPALIRELVIHVARDLLDSHSGGAAAIVGALESPMTLRDDSARLWRRCEMEYSAGRPERLGVPVSGGPRW